MTLSTYILLPQVDHLEAFDKVNDLLGIPNTRLTTDSVDDGIRDISNRPMQGFDAWVLSKSRVDGEPFTAEHDTGEWACEDDCDYWGHVASGYYVQINLDTAYSYQEPGIGGCADLHARIIVGLTEWLRAETDTDEPLRWVNEFAGTTHTGLDGIQEFIGSGDEANSWFSNVVVPAIPLIISQETQR